MKLKIVARQYQVNDNVALDADWQPKLWLPAQAETYGLTTLLAHADDGLIWGEVRGQALHLSSTHFPEVSPPLRTETLREARLFGSLAELHLWCVAGASWRARLVQDGAGPLGETFDEYQMLWGSHIREEKGGFSLLVDGDLGNRHAPPISASRLAFGPDEARRPLRLQVRHYLSTDKHTGLASVYLSRLVAVLPQTEVK